MEDKKPLSAMYEEIKAMEHRAYQRAVITVQTPQGPVLRLAPRPAYVCNG